MAGKAGTDAGNTEKGRRPEAENQEEVKPSKIIPVLTAVLQPRYRFCYL
jgi:hypothetical protein